MTGIDMPKAQEPSISFGLQTIDNSKDNAAWMAAHGKDPAVRSFLRPPAPPVQVAPITAAPGYFPGQ